MKTISKGRFGVLKQVKTKEATYLSFIARGSREECMLYIIDFAKNAFKLGWSSDVQLSLHIFPKTINAFFDIIKYNRILTESLRIEYKISKYTNYETKKTSPKR